MSGLRVAGGIAKKTARRAATSVTGTKPKRILLISLAALVCRFRIPVEVESRPPRAWSSGCG